MVLAITRALAEQRLTDFTPLAGSHYAKQRNFDYGAGAHDNVSRLSGALRRRTITETEVLAKVLGAHSFASCEKFVQEVFWRTYWKGWLEMRPSLWADYRKSVSSNAAADTVSQTHENALAGRTTIACFDEWHRELCETNYLHNHARMWFASIWIHTLGLPWQAGADLFMHHLSDGDPASNTLGWRWVAGLQTRGKAYGARADNIAQFTANRFAPYGLLQEDVAAIAGPENPPASAVRAPMQAAGTKPLLLITPEDCHPESLALLHQPVGAAFIAPDAPIARAKGVLAADEAAMSDGLARAQAHYAIPVAGAIGGANLVANLRALMTQWGADHIVMAFQPTGYWHDFLHKVSASAPELAFHEVMRPYDALCWPHAKKGFFPFKEKIPSFLSSL